MYVFCIFLQTSKRLEAGIMEGPWGHTFTGKKGHLGRTLGRISLQEERLDTGMGCPWRWQSHILESV